MSGFGWCVLYNVSIYPVFLSISVSFNLKLTKPKLQLKSEAANAPIAVILFMTLKSNFGIILNLQVYSFFNISSIYW